jgi:hypothetical protein
MKGKRTLYVGNMSAHPFAVSVTFQWLYLLSDFYEIQCSSLLQALLLESEFCASWLSDSPTSVCTVQSETVIGVCIVHCTHTNKDWINMQPHDWTDS